MGMRWPKGKPGRKARPGGKYGSPFGKGNKPKRPKRGGRRK